MSPIEKHAAAALLDVESAFAAMPASGILSAYVFGSRAEGRAHRESDIDIAILLDRARYPGARDRFEARLRLIERIGGALRGERIDLLVLNDTPPLLARRIVTTGRRIFCADPAADHAFIRDAQLRAADIEPWIRRTRRIKLEAIAR